MKGEIGIRNSLKPIVVEPDVVQLSGKSGDRKTECPRTLPTQAHQRCIAGRNESVRGHHGHRSWLTPKCPKNLILPMRPAAMPILVAGPYQFHTAANSFCRWNCSQLITSRDLIAAQYAPSTLAGSTPSRSAASFAERFSSPQITNAKRQKISSLAQTTLDSSSRTLHQSEDKTVCPSWM